MPTSDPAGLPGGLQLRELVRTDAQRLHEVKVANRERLTRFGDWTIPHDYGVDDVLAEFDANDYPKRSFGIWDGERLVGVVSLTAVTPEAWSIGYFLDEGSTGSGLATQACKAVLPAAINDGAAEIYGVVTHGNDASNRVLERAGFARIQVTKRSTRWWMPLRPKAGPPLMQVFAAQRGRWIDDAGCAVNVDVVEIGFEHLLDRGEVTPVVDDASNVVRPATPQFYGRIASAGSALTPFAVLEPGHATVADARTALDGSVEGTVEWVEPVERDRT